MQFYIAILFSIVAVVTAVLQFWPKTAASQEQPFLFPLLTMLAIDVVALLAPHPVNLLYKGALMLGLLVSTLAVVFFHIPKTPEYVGVAHFLVVFFLYFVGFVSANKVAIPSPILFLIAAYALLIYWLTRDALKEAQGAFVAYVVLMAFMLWAASEVWVQHMQQPWAVATFVGALLLVVSHSILLVDRTHAPIRWSSIAIAASFFLGQWLIAASVWAYGLPSA